MGFQFDHETSHVLLWTADELRGWADFYSGKRAGLRQAIGLMRASKARSQLEASYAYTDKCWRAVLARADDLNISLDR